MANADDRLTFDDAVTHVQSEGACAFTAIPVIADDGESVEGVRVYVLQRDGAGRAQVRFLAGAFFSNALAADEVWRFDEIPSHTRELQFLPSKCQDEWFSEQIQILVGRLVTASSMVVPEMPNYLGAANRIASPEVRFPVAMIGRPSNPGEKQ